jgi:hypothetical protein
MNISKIITNVSEYISAAVARIFGPNDDQYPEIGVQPFEGEPYTEKTTENR